MRPTRIFLASTGPWQALADALTQNTMLTELGLSENQIGDEGAKARPGFWVGFRGRFRQRVQGRPGAQKGFQ